VSSIARLGVAIALATLAACIVTTASRELPSIDPVNNVQTAGTGPISGTWQGRSTSYSNEIRDITLRMNQDGMRISGDYDCSPHNAFCRNLDDSGTVSGKFTNDKLAIEIILSPDNSQCFFTGKVAESLIYGDYECVDRARIVEIGTWRVKRLG